MGIPNITMRVIFCVTIFTFGYVVKSAPQRAPEINDQFQESNHTEVETKQVEHVEKSDTKHLDTSDIEHVETSDIQHVETSDIQHVETNAAIEDQTASEINTGTEITAHVQIKETKLQTREGFMTKLYIAIKRPIMQFIETPKVNTVLKNVGTCVVNGAMEIISFYFPAPMIPLIASAAGMIIPFEPVVMLRKRMPVTSYRRAFKTAVNSFMGTFDRFKRTSESEEDPYMTRRFNRRFLKDNSKAKDDRD